MTTDESTADQGGQAGADPMEPLPAGPAQGAAPPPSPSEEPSVQSGDAEAESAAASGGG